MKVKVFSSKSRLLHQLLGLIIHNRKRYYQIVINTPMNTVIKMKQLSGRNSLEVENILFQFF